MMPPIRISGQGEENMATAAAATSTPQLEMTSFREHSNVLAMFTFCARKRQSNDRQNRLATGDQDGRCSVHRQQINMADAMEHGTE